MLVPDDHKDPNQPTEESEERRSTDPANDSGDAKETDNFDAMSDEEKIDALIRELSHEETADDTDEPAQKKRRDRLSKQIKTLVEKSKKGDDSSPKKSTQKRQRPKKNRMLMIQLGGAFHGNFIINIILLYLVNLVTAMGLLEFLNLGSFPRELWVPLTFIFIYTTSEVVFKEFMVANFSKAVLVSFGSIFYVGYIVILYSIDTLIFIDTQIFNGPAELAVFTLLLMFVRQLLSIAIKKGLAFKL